MKTHTPSAATRPCGAESPTPGTTPSMASRALAITVILLFGWIGLSPASAASESEFYAALFRKETATVEDAVRLLARLGGYDGPERIESELRFLAESGVKFRKDVAVIRNSRLTTGNLAHMMIDALRLKGGVMARVFPGSQRYAVRQAVYLGLLPSDRSPDDVVSGKDLLGFVSKLAQTMAKQVARNE